MDYKARIKELREILEYNSKLYYDLDAPVMPDYEYDRLLRELEDLVFFLLFFLFFFFFLSF